MLSVLLNVIIMTAKISQKKNYYIKQSHTGQFYCTGLFSEMLRLIYPKDLLYRKECSDA